MARKYVCWGSGGRGGEQMCNKSCTCRNNLNTHKMRHNRSWLLNIGEVSCQQEKGEMKRLYSVA